MAADRKISEELAIHHARGITGAERPENLRVDQSGLGPFFAEQMARTVDASQRANAILEMNNRLRDQIVANPVAGRTINNLNDIRALSAGIDDGSISLSGQDEQNARNLQWLHYDVTDGVAVASIATLSADANTGQLIAGKNGQSVEQSLGVTGQMVGVGEIVVDSAVLDTKLRKMIVSLQKSASAGGLDLGELDRIRSVVEGLNLDEKVDEAEAEMLLAYLSSIAGAQKEEARIVEEARLRAEELRNQAFDAQQLLAERNLRLGEEAEKTTYDNWKGAILGKGGQTSLPGAIWTYTPTPEYQGEQSEWNGFLDEVTAMSNKVLQRRAALGGARDIGKAYFDANYPKVSERNLEQLYKDSRTGMRDALMTIVKDLFVETITEERNGELVVRKITQGEIDAGKKGLFVMKYGVEGVSEADQEGANVMAGKSNGGRREYVMRVAHLLMERDKSGTTSEDYAAMQASMALDFLELGFAMEAGDHKRQCSFAVDKARTNCRPGYKFGDKTAGGEVFVGAWTAYYQERFAEEIAAGVEAERRVAGGAWTDTMARDVENRLVVERARRDGLIPQVLCGSILDTEFKVEGGKMSLGRAMEAGIDLKLNGGSTEDLLFPIDKWFENASSFWGYVSSDEKLDFKGGLREADSILTDFAKGLNNAYADLKARGLIDVDDLIAAIGGAAGLIPSEPMVLNVPIVGASRGMTYAFLGDALLSHMPSLSEAERIDITRRLSFNSSFADKIPILWRESKNIRNGNNRQLFKDALLNKGGAAAKLYRKSLGG